MIRREKGSITLFVLIACMFMVVILLMVSIGAMNKNRSQEKQLEEIAKQYSQNETDMDNIYEKVKDESGVVNEVIDMIYPVGSIYITTNEKNPGEYFGGEWVAYGEGKTIVGVDDEDEDFATVKITGGEKTHKLTEEELPSHAHTFSVVTSSAGAHTHGTGNSSWTHFAIADNDKITRRTVYGGSGTNKGYTWTTDSTSSYKDMGSTDTTSSAGAHTHTVSGTTATVGSGKEYNNMQPYIVTYMWERIS